MMFWSSVSVNPTFALLAATCTFSTLGWFKQSTKLYFNGFLSYFVKITSCVYTKTIFFSISLIGLFIPSATFRIQSLPIIRFVHVLRFYVIQNLPRQNPQVTGQFVSTNCMILLAVLVQKPKLWYWAHWKEDISTWSGLQTVERIDYKSNIKYANYERKRQEQIKENVAF